MSFDLGVWQSESAISDGEAGELYLKLCNGEWKPSGSSPALEAFYQELTGRYPEIDSVPEQDVDSCPWNCAMDRSGGHVLMNIAWSRAEEIAPIVISIAVRKGLICFDPQEGKVHLPPNLKSGKSRFRFW